MTLVYREETNQSISDIYVASLKGFQQWLAYEWNKLVVSPDLTLIYSDKEEADKQLDATGSFDRDNESMFPDPLVTLRVVQYEHAMDRYNRHMSNYYGWQVRNIGQHGMVQTEHVYPVNVGIGIRFETKNLRLIETFNHVWAKFVPVWSFKIKIPDSDQRVSIKGRFDPQMDINTIENDVRTVETTLILETYMGITHTNPTVKDLVFNSHVLRRGEVVSTHEHQGEGH